jgi:hypothetical protein
MVTRRGGVTSRLATDRRRLPAHLAPVGAAKDLINAGTRSNLPCRFCGKGKLQFLDLAPITSKAIGTPCERLPCRCFRQRPRGQR